LSSILEFGFLPTAKSFFSSAFSYSKIFFSSYKLEKPEDRHTFDEVEERSCLLRQGFVGWADRG